MEDAEIIREAARNAGITTEQAEKVLATVKRSPVDPVVAQAEQEERARAALEKAKEALMPPPEAGRTGLIALPSIRHLRGIV
jgi:hypothetical protein